MKTIQSIKMQTVSLIMDLAYRKINGEITRETQLAKCKNIRLAYANTINKFNSAQ